MLERTKSKPEFPQKAVALFKPAPYKVVFGGRGGAKCLKLGTRIIMFDGSLRAIEDVREGEFVMGPDSAPRRVLGTSRGHGKLYRIKQTSGMDYTVNAGHILSLKKSTAPYQFKDWPEITNISVEHVLAQSAQWREIFLGWRITKYKDCITSQITIEEAGDGEWAGIYIDGDHLFLLEDGTVTHNTWSLARALLILASRRKLFVLCAREIQKSIRDSVHKTLADQIDEMGLGWFYRVTENSIIGKNGSRFAFAGIRNNISSIKSMEAIDICAVFEATFVSRNSWEVLLPTIRRDAPHGPFQHGSEIWIEFNPELATDETYQRWVVNPPEGTVIIEMNFRDNPWFPEFLEKQRISMKKRDYDSYLTVWEGKTRKTVIGSIYAREIALAVKENRISPHIRFDRSKPVDVSFDLGRSDMCAMWFWQQRGMEHIAADFYGNTGYDFTHYIEEIQQRKYVIGKIYLPHDAAHHHPSATKSIETQAREAFPGTGRVIVVPRISNITIGINIVRNLWPRVLINEVTCQSGLMALQHYQYDVDLDTNQRSINPLHNWASNPSDSFRTYCEGLHDPEKIESKDDGERPPRGGRVSWLGR